MICSTWLVLSIFYDVMDKLINVSCTDCFREAVKKSRRGTFRTERGVDLGSCAVTISCFFLASLHVAAFRKIPLYFKKENGALVAGQPGT